jgi:hypothetical protein
MSQAQSPQQIEMFMRFDKSKKIFEFRPYEQAPIIVFTEVKAADLLRTLVTKPEQHKILKFLFDEAKKDPKGNWVQASSSPLSDGQALV